LTLKFTRAATSAKKQESQADATVEDPASRLCYAPTGRLGCCWSGYDQHGCYHSGTGQRTGDSIIRKNDPGIDAQRSDHKPIRQLKREGKEFALEFSSGRVVQVWDQHSVTTTRYDTVGVLRGDGVFEVIVAIRAG
jgi:hypothetical protein